MIGNEEAIERLIVEEVLPDSGLSRIDHDESLISGGILDSLTLIQLVMLIEDRFGIIVEDGELIPDNFETINMIQKFLETKRSNTASFITAP